MFSEIPSIKTHSAVMFLGYWQDDAATQDKFAGEYLLTGDQGEMDAEGYIRFLGRDDDIITSAGYRIGPGPIEDCLLGHPAVRLAAVVGVPDPQRTQIVKACIVLNAGYCPNDALSAELKDYVRQCLANMNIPA